MSRNYQKTTVKTHIQGDIIATGTSFILGKVFRPTIEDVTEVLAIFDRRDHLEPVLPVLVDLRRLLDPSRNYRLLKLHLETITENLGAYYDHKAHKWVFPDDPDEGKTLTLLLWVLVCYNYKINRGPKPRLPGVRVPHLFTTRTDGWYCTYCGAKYRQPDRKASDAVRFRRYLVWMIAHGVEFHRWFTLGQFWVGFKKDVQDMLSFAKTQRKGVDPIPDDFEEFPDYNSGEVEVKYGTWKSQLKTKLLHAGLGSDFRKISISPKSMYENHYTVQEAFDTIRDLEKKSKTQKE